MKGVYIQNQLEYRLEAKGDEFRQGESISCVVTVKNHSSSSRTSPEILLALACANLNKAKQKSDDAFEIIASADTAPAQELAPGASRNFAWTFELDRNCTITDKSQTLYLLYGNGNSPLPDGRLPVTVRPHDHIPKFLSILQNTFQFVIKAEKSVDGWVHVKLKPPTARKLSLVEELVLCFRFEGETLVLKYVFKVKRFEATAAAIGVSKGKAQVEQRFEPRDYLASPEYVNHPHIEAKIEEALAVVATGL